MCDFVHLHVHSEYSLLDGLGRTKDLAQEAARLGQKALALTDHGVMHGAVEFFRNCQKNGVKPIIGVEAYITPYGTSMQEKSQNHHLLLLAENMTGYQNLLKLSSEAQLNGFYRRPRIDADLLAAHSDGLICTTGCMAAEIPSLLNPERDMPPQPDKALERLRWYLNVFGRERFFIELQEHSIPALTEINKTLFDWSKSHNIELLVTNDVHYVTAQDASPHDTLLCVQTNSLVNQQKRMRLSDSGYYLKSEDEMRELFRPLVELPDSAFTNSAKIAEMCNVDLEDKSFHLPDLPDQPYEIMPRHYQSPQKDYPGFLRHLAEQGLESRYGEQATSKEVRDRLEHELAIINRMNFAVYFLIVWDLCRFARENNIWWNVRGSGAGSIVAYATGITLIDPLKNNLIFERFLNPGRVSMPDFDLDYPDDQRELLIRYTLETYGAERVAQIVSFGRMKARAAIRDVGRAMDIPLDEVDRIAKMIAAIPGKPVTIDNVLDPEHEFYSAELKQLYQEQEQVTQLVDFARNLEGVARHSSVHAAAVIITDEPLTSYVPVMRPSGNSVITPSVTQFEFPICESIGLLKVDFLGLSTLTVMRKAAELIKARHGIGYTLENLNIDVPGWQRIDPNLGDNHLEKAFHLLSSGNVTGVFQVEGEGFRRVLMDMRPTRFEHIVALLALYRPGPLQYIPNFIRRMHGEEEVEFKHPKLEPILGETYGICVSGDALVTDAETGLRYRLDELYQGKDMLIQGVDDDWKPAVGRVTNWIDSGYKDVYEVTLRNGASIKITADHHLLTENSWQPLSALQVGDYIATPPYLIGPSEQQLISREKLRILAYLIADGSLASMAAVDFVSKDTAMLEEYKQCLSTFENVRFSYTEQLRSVSRIGVAKKTLNSNDTYHTPNSLLTWLRELGLKAPPGSQPGGLRSHEKFIPPLVFELEPESIAFFLASLWDCDGYMGRKICHYKTISAQLARDVQTLLLRLSIPSTIYVRDYVNNVRQNRCSYQVTVYETKQLAALLQPFMVTEKKQVLCNGKSKTTIDRATFVSELDKATSLSRRGLEQQYGISRQHFLPQALKRDRISSQVIAPVAQALMLPETNRHLNVNWQEIISIETAGVDHVYDLTVEGLHSFVANNIVVHNCVYQEQIMQIATNLAGYNASEADFMRRAVAKKKEKELLKHKAQMLEGGEERGIPKEVMQEIFSDIESFARYGFPKGHAADYALVTCQTAYLKAHYPIEYLTALLTVERNNTDKVSALMGECRAMGIKVLPPHVNYSRIDFVIDDESEAEPSIRFGMSAIKNVGEGPIEAILEVRDEGGPFSDVDDFCQRVDLRKVNRRALEGLIKVGALGCFEPNRNVLLAIIDRMLNLSSSTHKAAAAGQMSMFGMVETEADTAASSVLNPRPQVAQAERKEMLEWEKELVGTYLSEHPIQKNLPALKASNVTMLSDITERINQKQVRVAGVILSVRDHRTKKGDPMAFVEIQDMETTRELVIFPRTYTAYKELLKDGELIIVRGKVDAQQGRTAKVLADEISTELPQIGQAKGTAEARKPYPQQPPNGHDRSNGHTIAEQAVSYRAKPPADEVSSPPQGNGVKLEESALPLPPSERERKLASPPLGSFASEGGQHPAPSDKASASGFDEPDYFRDRPTSTPTEPDMELPSVVDDVVYRPVAQNAAVESESREVLSLAHPPPQQTFIESAASKADDSPSVTETVKAANEISRPRLDMAKSHQAEPKAVEAETVSAATALETVAKTAPPAESSADTDASAQADEDALAEKEEAVTTPPPAVQAAPVGATSEAMQQLEIKTEADFQHGPWANQPPLTDEAMSKVAPILINIRIPDTGERVMDEHRLKMVVQFLSQLEGEDRFAIHISDKIKVDFPNHTTRYSDKLRLQLVRILSPEAIWIEPL